MMSTAHTPGPWFYDDSNKSRLIINSEWAAIASIPYLDAEAVANARLIAAAPNLLAALEHAVETLSAEGFDVSMLRAAITKATGAAA